MSLSKEAVKDLLERGYSRRNIAHIALGAAAVLPFFHESVFAQSVSASAATPTRGGGGAYGGRAPVDPDAVVIGGNENPMGPTKQGLEAIAQVSLRPPRPGRWAPAEICMQSGKTAASLPWRSG